jgi:hypothetical protein
MVTSYEVYRQCGEGCRKSLDAGSGGPIVVEVPEGSLCSAVGSNDDDDDYYYYLTYFDVIQVSRKVLPGVRDRIKE